MMGISGCHTGKQVHGRQMHTPD